MSRRTLEMNLSKIKSVNVDQSIFGRLLGYGTITIIGTGRTGELFPNIAEPLQFRKKFQELSLQFIFAICFITKMEGHCSSPI